MKTIVLSIELELFFGADSGTVENSIIRPTEKLLKILDVKNMKATFFWDVMHYVRLCELAPEVPNLALDKELMEKLITKIIHKGHDVQLHLHPHWLDAVWDGYRWKFSYQRYTIQDLSKKNDIDDVNTIIGCITKAKRTMESLCRQADQEYFVNAFRAGGNRTMPFEDLGNALKQNGIIIDSSAGKGLERTNSFAPIRYTDMPEIQFYPFNTSPIELDSNGVFWEFPIETVSIPFALKCYFKFLYKWKYAYEGIYGDGTGVGKLRVVQKKPKFACFHKEYLKLSPEKKLPEEWKYMVKSAREMAVAVIQPKNMGPRSFDMLEQSIKNNELAFISLQQRLNQLGIHGQHN